MVVGMELEDIAYVNPTAEVTRRAHLDRLANVIAEETGGYIKKVDNLAKSDLNCILGYDNGYFAQIYGEVHSNLEMCHIRDIAEDIVRSNMGGVGYDADTGFDYDDFDMDLRIKKQSPSLTDNANSKKSGDTRTVWGMSCKYGDRFGEMILSCTEQFCREVVDRLDRAVGSSDYILPDGKITVKLDDDKFRTTMQVQHTPDVGLDELREHIYDVSIGPAIDKFDLDDGDCEFMINGPMENRIKFILGGARADTGTSNHKLLAYGESMQHGGGGPWGKDYSKPEKFGWFMARRVANWVVDEDIAKVAVVKLGYDIGCDESLVYVDAVGSPVENDYIEGAIRDGFELDPDSIVESLNLQNNDQMVYGAKNHIFGDPRFGWE